MAVIEEFRRAKDHMFGHDPETPIPADERAGFAGLSYFEPDPALVITAQVGPPEDTDELRMPTSTNAEVTYQRYGVAHFTIGGAPAQLTLFASEGDRDLFVPFRDSTSGKETYGAGRYLEVTRPHDDMVELDFNYAYNPYCAYSEAYSCPLPPMENWLKVPIRAGEKIYEGSAHS
jgi:uncharacterized protein (DUF1684 family)